MAGIAKIQADLLRGAGHEVDQIELPSFGASWSWPGKAVALPLRTAAYLPGVLRIRRKKYDVVHIHWLAQGIVGVLSGRRFFVQAHGSDLHLNLQNPVYRRITLSALEHATAVFYVTPNLKGYLGAYENKLVYLPNPVDVQAIARDPIAPTRVAKVLIFTRLDPVKGVDQIFPAAQTLSRTIELTALSWGPLRTSYRQTYGRFVSFVRPLPRPAIGPFLQQFDLVIGQMQQGILSLMEIEAMAAGRPVITGINLDLYRDDPPPVLRASDPERIIAAVESLRSRPQELARLSRDGRDWVVRNHSHAHHLEVLEAAYFGKA